MSLFYHEPTKPGSVDQVTRGEADEGLWRPHTRTSARAGPGSMFSPWEDQLRLGSLRFIHTLLVSSLYYQNKVGKKWEVLYAHL